MARHGRLLRDRQPRLSPPLQVDRVGGLGAAAVERAGHRRSRAWRRRRHRAGTSALVPPSPAARRRRHSTRAQRCPAYAFWSGHPFRIRYMVVLSMALATTTGLGVGLLRARTSAHGPQRSSLIAAIVETPPLSRRFAHGARSAMGQSRGVSNAGVSRVSERKRRDGRPILASMGSLAHYMQETSPPASRSATTFTKASARSGPTASQAARGMPAGS